MTVEGSAGDEGQKPGTKTQQGLGGITRFRGAAAEFDIKVAKKPTAFWLDQRGELPATFVAEERYPKTALRLLGERLTGHGDGSEAERSFRSALAAPVVDDEASASRTMSKRETERAGDRVDADIHLCLAELYLDRRRDGEAPAELEAAEKLLVGVESEMYSARRKDIRSRLDLLEGKADAVYGRLSRILYLEFLQRADESTADSLRRVKFGEGRPGTGAEYAMLAVAAHETGNEAVCEQAREEAAKLGVDLAALDALHAGK